MLFTNACIFRADRGFARGSLWIEDGRIQKMTGEMEGVKAPDSVGDGSVMDLEGAYVLPGLVDVHTHGNSGYDFSDGRAEGLTAMGRYLAYHGITSFAPTSMTLPYDRLKAAFLTARFYEQNRPADGAFLAGIHMEGPYLSKNKKGAQNSAFLREPDVVGFEALQRACGGLIRIVDIAPELAGALDFIRRVSPECRVSAAHTEASYEEAARAFEAGASHVTHLFNAMPPLHHRRPGVIGAACEREAVKAELICDGLHVHPSMVRLAFRLFPGRICLISDALRCCGMPEGEYELGGQMLTLRDGQARLADGTLAGAAANLYEDMVNAMRFGIPAREAILAATLIPASEIGIAEEAGSLAEGKRADFLVCGRDWTLRQVYLEGRRIR